MPTSPPLWRLILELTLRCFVCWFGLVGWFGFCLDFCFILFMCDFRCKKASSPFLINISVIIVACLAFCRLWNCTKHKTFMFSHSSIKSLCIIAAVLFKKYSLIDWITFSKSTTIYECLRKMGEHHTGKPRELPGSTKRKLMSHGIRVEFAIGKKMVVSVQTSLNLRSWKWVGNVDDKGYVDVWPMLTPLRSFSSHTKVGEYWSEDHSVSRDLRCVNAATVWEPASFCSCHSGSEPAPPNTSSFNL